ncbi:lamin tail domain-containing protein [bacterium]|nr:lamin tail domain-containing protein [bacterium]
MAKNKQESTGDRFRRLTQALTAILLCGVSAQAADIADHVVIAEVLPHPADGQAVFVELYNPTNEELTLDDYYLRSNLEHDYPALSGSIPAYGFYLIATAEEDWPDGWADPDLTAPQLELDPYSGGVALLDGSDTLDMLGWGVSPYFYETTPCNIPNQGESFERKSGSSHDDGEGNGYDTDNNIFDFHVRSDPEPQNTYSDTERPPMSADEATWGFIKDLYGPQR